MAAEEHDGGAAQSPGALVPLAETLVRLHAIADCAEPRRVPLDDAVGHVLAAPLIVPVDRPPHAMALRPGYAVDAASLAGASPYSPAWLATLPRHVNAGEALPEGTDAILPAAALEQAHGAVTVWQAVAPGQDVRRRGEDAKAGSILRGSGLPLRRYDVALASTAGIDHAETRSMRVAIAAADADTAVVDCIAAFARRSGASVLRSPGDEGADGSADILVVLANDPTLGDGEDILAAAIAIRPGDRIACRRRGTMPVLVVPPRPADAFAACVLLLLHWLDHKTARASREARLSGRLTRKIASAIGLSEIVLVRQTEAGIEPIAIGDLTLHTLAAAEGWLVVPPDSEGYPAGEPVAAFALDDAVA